MIFPAFSQHFLNLHGPWLGHTAFPSNFSVPRDISDRNTPNNRPIRTKHLAGAESVGLPIEALIEYGYLYRIQEI